MITFLYGVIIAAVAFSFAMQVWNHFHADKILHRWASDEGYTVLSFERRWLRTGPFYLRNGMALAVFYVTVRTAGGQVQCGWVQCGSRLLGFLTDPVDVAWDV